MFFVIKSLLLDNQHGFCQKQSLFHAINYILRTINKSFEVHSIYKDLGKASDKVNFVVKSQDLIKLC